MTWKYLSKQFIASQWLPTLGPLCLARILAWLLVNEFICTQSGTVHIDVYKNVKRDAWNGLHTWSTIFSASQEAPTSCSYRFLALGDHKSHPARNTHEQVGKVISKLDSISDTAIRYRQLKSVDCSVEWLTLWTVQGRARLGTVVHKKTAAALALTNVKSEDQREFAKIVETAKSSFNDGPRVNWGGGIMGPKSQAKAKKRDREIQRELAQRA